MHACTIKAATIKNDPLAKKRVHLKGKAEPIQDHASNKMQLAMDTAKENGASSWLSVFLINEYVSSCIMKHSRMLWPCSMEAVATSTQCVRL